MRRTCADGSITADEEWWTPWRPTSTPSSCGLILTLNGGEGLWRSPANKSIPTTCRSSPITGEPWESWASKEPWRSASSAGKSRPWLATILESLNSIIQFNDSRIVELNDRIQHAETRQDQVRL